ncbi:MAG: magnesium/cobalt efflux protein, partial [Pseudoxanthomonas sp.]
MSEDDSIPAPEVSDKPEKRRSWLDRISSAFSGEPSSRDDLVALLRDAHSDGLIASDTLRMME